MPEIAIPHVIGTLMLLMLMSVVSLYAVSIGLNAEFTTTTVSLQEISENVASEIISMVDLSTVSGKPFFTYKEIDIPEAISNRGYIIKMEQDDNNPTWKIVAYLNEYPSIKGEAKLFFSSFETQALTCQSVDNEDTIITKGGQALHLIKSSFLYSGTGKAATSRYKPVVWCQLYDDTDGIEKIKVGLGRLEVS